MMLMMSMMKHQVYETASAYVQNDVTAAVDFDSLDSFRRLDEQQPPQEEEHITITIDDDVIIQEVSVSVKILLGIMSVLVGTAALLSIIVMIHYRKHTIMTLSQSPFLVALSSCLLTSSIFTFTDLPTRDVFCSMRDLLVDLPLTIAATIILARVWRVHVTLSNANMFARGGGGGGGGRRKTVMGNDDNAIREDRFSVGVVIVATLTFLARLPFRIISCCNWGKRDESSNETSTGTTSPKRRRGKTALKQTATARETVWLIILLTLPELVILIVSVALYKPRLELILDPNTPNSGQYVCTDSSHHANDAWVQKFSLAWMTVIFVAAIIVAWLGRDLPPFFNEKTVRIR
jgi:7 transmembrane sweet-taste receptor of 3 GCPR